MAGIPPLTSLAPERFGTLPIVERDLEVSRITATKYLNLLADGGILRKQCVGRGYYHINEALTTILTRERAM